MPPSATLALLLLAVIPVTGTALAQDQSLTLQAAIRAQRVVDDAIQAIGGRTALNAIGDLAWEATIRRTAARQGLRPSEPSVTHGRSLSVFDFAGERVSDLRLLDITGNQLWDIQQLITPSSAHLIYWPSLTVTSSPGPEVPRVRAAVVRRHLVPLLMAIDRRPEAVRWMGATTLAGRVQDALSYTDVDGALLTLLVDRETHLPTAIEQLASDPAIGDTVNRTLLGDYRPAGRLLLPFRLLDTRPPGEQVEYLVQRYAFDTHPADSMFEVPPDLIPSAARLRDIVTLAPDVYLIPNAYNTIFIAFDDYVLVLEAGGSTRATASAIDQIRRTVPGKAIRYVVATHFHNDHLAGLRSFIAEGATIVTTADARGPIESLARAEPRLAPDALSRAPRRPVIETVERERVFRDARHEVRLYQLGPSPHVDQILIAHLPLERILFEGDLLDIVNGQPSAGGDDTQDFARKVERLGLAFERIVPVHGSPGTAADLTEGLRRGRARAGCPTGEARREPCRLDAMVNSSPR